MDKLHIDMLKPIFDRLDFKSLLRCKSVCKTWRHRLPTTPKMPWLWISPHAKKESNHYTLLSVADHAAQWYQYLHFPKYSQLPDDLILEFQCISSSGSWLVLSILLNGDFMYQEDFENGVIDYVVEENAFVGNLDNEYEYVMGGGDEGFRNSNLFVYEPFSYRLLGLPHMYFNHTFSIIDARYSCFIPSNGQGMVAMCNPHEIFICRPDDHAWTKLEYFIDNNASVFDDLVLHGTDLYVVMRSGRLVIFNVGSYPENILPRLSIPMCPLLSFVSSPPGSTLNSIDQLAVAVESDDDIFLVRKILFNYPDQITRNSSFDVLKLEQGRFVKVDNLGPRMLFYGNGGCYPWNGAGLRSPGFFTLNCIYYVDWVREERYPFRLGKFSLANPGQNEFKEIPEELWTAVSRPYRKPSWLLPC